MLFVLLRLFHPPSGRLNLISNELCLCPVKEDAMLFSPTCSFLPIYLPFSEISYNHCLGCDHNPFAPSIRVFSCFLPKAKMDRMMKILSKFPELSLVDPMSDVVSDKSLLSQHGMNRSTSILTVGM